MPRDPADHARVAELRILLVSQMYPGPDDPDLGVFVANLERELVARGHEIERAVVSSRRGGPARHVRLLRDSRRAARRFAPEVAYAHFLVPAGLAAALATRAPLVVTAHGRDVANIGSKPGVRAATRHVVKRASAVIAVSQWLRDLLESTLGEARGKCEVIDCGVDLERFAPRDTEAARAQLGWSVEGTAFLCLGGLTEPFGLATLEAMASARSVVTTTVGGPPEFVTQKAGVLVDPLDDDGLIEALSQAAALPQPNLAGREAAAEHDVRRQAERVEEILLRAARDRRA